MRIFFLMLVFLLSACEEKSDPQQATETLTPKAWSEILNVEGEIKAASNTPLTVPGNGWESRTLIEMVAEGSVVKKGQVIARFDAPKSRMELSQAETELLRKELAEESILASDTVNRSQLSAESAKVNSDLNLSQRYAGADISMFSRNQILDALQDVGFLGAKRNYLNWKTGQIQARNGAERALLQSQKDSVVLNAEQQRKSLAALELIAPHDGVFLLTASWDGSKPQIGSSQRAGQEFGSLPDLEKLVARFSVEEGRAFGITQGLPLSVRLAGSGTEIDLKISQAGNSATIKSSESPVKYSDFEANISREVIQKLALKPGQALSAKVYLINQQKALTVPNIALVQEGAAYAVYIRKSNQLIKHKVEVGIRGPVRSEIKSGLSAGEQIVLMPESKEKKS